MSRTLDEPLTIREINHLRDNLWQEFSSREEEKLDRSLKYIEVLEILEKIAVCIHFVKLHFQLNPGNYNDILGASEQFFIDIINSVYLVN